MKINVLGNPDTGKIGHTRHRTKINETNKG